MNTPDPETTAFRMVYASLLDRIPDAPAFEELASRAARQALTPPHHRRSALVAIWAGVTSLVVFVAVWPGRAPSALAVIDEARSAAASAA